MYEHIPAELKTEQAWVNVWNVSKCPMQTGIRKGASAVVPSTWGAFDDAVANVENGFYHGIGYVFHDTGLVGIDIDDGFDEEGFLSETARDIISRCRSYTERSRSGRGFHILLRGDLPFKGKNNRQGVEIYKSSRYFIMTGKRFLFTEIIDNQDAIDYILERYFSAEKESGGDKTDRIYTPIYPRPANGRIPLRPVYPEIQSGGRNLCLTSLAGQLHSQGYTKAAIYMELLTVNKTACKPPLTASEIEQIVNSVTRYRR